MLEDDAAVDNVLAAQPSLDLGELVGAVAIGAVQRPQDIGAVEEAGADAAIADDERADQAARRRHLVDPGLATWPGRPQDAGPVLDLHVVEAAAEVGRGDLVAARPLDEPH